jgi:hypothetical protein
MDCLSHRAVSRSEARCHWDVEVDTCSRDLRSLLHLILANQISKCSNWHGLLVTSRGAGGVPLEKRSRMSLRRGSRHVFSRPAVASSFDFSKSNFEVLELTWGTLELTWETLELTWETLELTRIVWHIERSRDAKPDVIATCTYARVLDYARTDSETSRTDRDCGHWAQWNSDDNLNEIATARSRRAVTERSRNVLNLVVWHLKTLQKQ